MRQARKPNVKDRITSSLFNGSSRLEPVLQSEAAECGLACLTMIARYHGHEVDLNSLRRRYGSSLKGSSLAHLIATGRNLGFDARALRAEMGYISRLKMPCVLHWDLNHFVVLEQVDRRGAHILDPANGARLLPLQDVGKHFTGVALELAPSANFEPIKDVEHVRLRTLTGRMRGLGKVFLQILGLSVGIEALSLLLPFQMQWVVDRALISADRNLLLIICLAFFVVVLAQSGLMFMRAWVISWVGAVLSEKWTINLFSHLMRLPLDFFEKRHIGDMVSRFTSLSQIQQTLTGSFVEALLDGVVGLLALLVLISYDIYLALVVLVSAGLYAMLRLIMYKYLWRNNEEQLIYGARQQSELMESVRGVQAIKLANRQADRVLRLANLTQETVLRAMRSQRIGLAFTAINQGVFGIQRVVIVTIGAHMVLKGGFTAGMLVAFLAFADQLTHKVGGVIDKTIDLKMLRLHMQRIGDIALAQPEQESFSSFHKLSKEPSVAIRNLSFRYSDSEPWIFRNLDLKIKAGESLAIIGPSGCGKSTLAKIILGLLKPTQGSVEVDGVNIERIGMTRYRDEVIAAVMQNDQLFGGSIAENIAFGDMDASMEKIIGAAVMAEIHDDVVAMPMGYESLVGDMGSSLSGGQKQRVIFARAMYRKPRILLLDEATSHLDVDREGKINLAVKRIKATRIIIAHRKETIESADRIFDMGKSLRNSSQVA
ncbi:TPA: peptidase domain-containing ABC transporter [Xanthomonas vasicola pv. zeae]|uniref:Peptidase domain-containing ABC transporter n=3 Tax=Xanthomonas vasicola TaxID=56459 RepID=A0AAE8F6J3_XANVA|nr:peptidase domain-containing ABC transporter [Xanthomonas vasicola pv. vasculorum]TWQ19646.1 peptidase domain-containing ABC transporter [Xanthomonas vasicola]HHZ33022.1 peptidase domain-containing ABC transporter [Xanthomonas vasicola pv. zeae]AZM72146.1 ABC transporter [Xanthomonas vasicola pv. vasculorum]MBV7305003.1 peptidase domain-containing ABC transporter [Xanthomonas vasicola pv. vasculorum]